MELGVLTIAYDGYGKFLKGWFECVFMLKPKQAVVVLSRDHGITYREKRKIITEGEKIGTEVKFVHKRKRLSMGELRNEGVKKMNTEWILYFSADDALLPNARRELEAKQHADVIALKYYQRKGNRDEERETPIPEPEKLLQWRKYYGNAGYVAFRRKVWEELPYENTDYPNFPFMFRSVVLGHKWEKTDNPCAMYLKRPDGHFGRRTKDHNARAYRTLNEASVRIYTEHCKREYKDFMDVVYLLDTRRDSKILPLSIRTLKNIRYKSIFIVGKVPRKIIAGEIPFEDQKGHPIENIKAKLRAVIEDERVSDNFILMNDDFLILQKYDIIEYYHRGKIKNYKPNSYWRKNTEKLLEIFPEGRIFNLHFPIVYNKEKLAETLDKMEDREDIRTHYCNYNNIKGVYSEDYKTYRKADIAKYKDAPFLSTTDVIEHTRIAELEKLLKKRGL